MKSPLLTILTLGATLAGVLAAPMPNDPYDCGAPFCGLEKRQSNPDGECPRYCNPFTSGLPWCASCMNAGGGKAKRSTAPELEAMVESSLEDREAKKQKQKQHDDPYWCGAAFCDKKEKRAPAPDVPAAEVAPKLAPKLGPEIINPKRQYDCGAPFCRADSEAKTKRQYDCGAPFCRADGEMVA